MNENYRSVHSYGIGELTIEKSLFIGRCKPVQTEEEAIDFINSVKEEHKTATHNCYAYVIGKNLQRFSDDREPSHTAGMPMLTTLIAEDLTNICVVVTRYFGGVLLGKGGLVRAYTQSTKLALEKAIIVDKISHYKVLLRTDYQTLGAVENYLLNSRITVSEVTYLEEVRIEVYVVESEYDTFLQDLLNLTSGKIVSESIGSIYLSVKNDSTMLR